MSILPSLPVPSTAALTSRLGLMDPVDSDFFKSSDFKASMEILDAVPGTLPVANLAALNALTWTTAQHGSRVLQLDNGAEWYWYAPSGAGVWKRTNTIGVVATGTLGAPVTTTVTTSGPTFLRTPTFTAPGVRSLRIDLYAGVDNPIAWNSLVILDLYDNGVNLQEWSLRAGQRWNNNGISFFNSVYIDNPTAGSSHQISVTIRAANAVFSIGGGGTAGVHDATLRVIEV